MLVQGLMPTTKTQIYTTPASAEIKTIKLHNYSGVDVVVELFSKKASSLKFDSFILAGGDSIEISPSFPMVFTTGEGIEGQANVADSVNYFISGRQS